MKKKDKGAPGRIATNPKAKREYQLLETHEAGLVLTGSEVKSLRGGKASLREAFAIVDGGELWLVGMHIPVYPQAGYSQHDPYRRRKLLLHREQIDRLAGKTRERGQTLVPVSCYFKGSVAKIELALARGKKSYDRREDIKERDAIREAERALSRRR